MKHQLTILTILVSTYASGQEYLIDLRIQKILYKGDSLVYEIPKTFESTTTQVTSIIEIGKIGDNRFGVQIELLRSKLGQEERTIAGRTYYSKRGQTSDWRKLLTTIYQKVNLDDLKNRVEKEEIRQKKIKEEGDEDLREMYLSTNSDTNSDFGVYYYNYFYNKK